MIQQTDNLHGFHVAVSVVAPKPPNTSAFERMVLWMGPPDAVIRACNRLSILICLGGVAYVVAWVFLISAAFIKAVNPTPGQVTVIALAWTPLMAFQLFLGAVRYGVAGLHVKAAEQAAKAISAEFFDAISSTVASAVESTMEEHHQRAEKPTLQ